MTKDSRIIFFLWSSSFVHRMDFLGEIFCNMLLKIHIISSIHHFFVLNFDEELRIF
jgi:hypothetical protein